MARDPNWTPDDDEQYSRNGPVCPHCGEGHNPDDEIVYSEDEELDCIECGRRFSFSCHLSYSWTSRKSEEKRPD